MTSGLRSSAGAVDGRSIYHMCVRRWDRTENSPSSYPTTARSAHQHRRISLRMLPESRHLHAQLATLMQRYDTSCYDALSGTRSPNRKRKLLNQRLSMLKSEQARGKVDRNHYTVTQGRETNAIECHASLPSAHDRA
jgi:hypothetical protein